MLIVSQDEDKPVRPWSLAVLVAAVATCQSWERPRDMYCGGNQLVDMGELRAESLSGVVVDPTGAEISLARVQVQLRGSDKLLHDFQANGKGRFALPELRPGTYWLGVSSPGFNLHFWRLQIAHGARHKTLKVELSLGT